MLCRRAVATVAEPVAVEPASRAPRWIAFGTVVLTASGAAAWSMRSARWLAPPPSAASPLVELPPVGPASKPAPTPKPAEDELTKSLRMLEQAEQDRRAREQAEQAREQERRTAASRERERDEKAQDARRHELVKRELDGLSLASARCNVSIIMYSTSWCGVCSRARAYMQERSIPFTDLDVEHDAAAHARQRALNPRGTVPTITIDDDVLIGFSPDSLENRIERAARRRVGS